MNVLVSTQYVVKCHDRRGRLRWERDFHNLVVTAGLNKLLDATFKTGLAAPAWYIGLKGPGTPLAADTMVSHTSWNSITPFSDATRPAFVPGTIAAGAVSNSASEALFNINDTATIYGCFLTDNAAKTGSAGTLYGVGDFGAPDDVAPSDVLTVLITLGMA